MLSKNDLLEATDIGSDRTLIRWHRAGVIPAPEVSISPNGRGRTGRWPDWVLPRCLRVRKLVQAGKSLEEIRDLLGTDWEKEAREYRKRQRKRSRYVFAEIAAQMEYDAAANTLVDLVCEKVLPFFTARKSHIPAVLRQLTEAIGQKEMIEKLLGYVRGGMNPVLILAEEVDVVPDFLVGPMLAHDLHGGEPRLVLPIHAEFTKAMGTVIQGLPSEPTVTPVARAEAMEGRNRKEYDVHVVGAADFELTPRNPRKRKSKR